MSMVLGMAVASSIISCNEDVLTQPGPEEVSGPVTEQMATSGLSGINQEKLALLPAPNLGAVSARSPISYLGVLVGTESVTATHAYKNSIDYSGQWDYYSFYGEAGNIISLDVDRVSCGMDPGFSLFYGVTNDNGGVDFQSGGPNMQYLVFQDDDNDPSCTPDPYCFAWYDPLLSDYSLPYTGLYTVAVYDLASCTDAQFKYTLHFEILGPVDTNGDGVYNDLENCPDTYKPGQENCDGDAYGDACDPDDDNDGVMDEADVFDCSNMDATINLDGCDSGVANAVFEDGMTMMDAIHVCATNAGNHGDFVSCVALLTNQWKKAGLITGYDKELIMDCVGAANIP